MSDFADDVMRYLPDTSQPEPIVMRGAPIDLTRHRLVYLGSPYTKYATGLDAAFQDVCAIAAELLKEGVKVYSPIAHTHPIAIHGNLDPRNHDIWLPFDQAMMDAADAMVIADMDGWRESYGVRFEIETFQRAGKPVYFRDRMGFVSDYLG
jgi:nucleoside 2-deoxyribosyltransferase